MILAPKELTIYWERRKERNERNLLMTSILLIPYYLLGALPNHCLYCSR